MKTRTRIQFLSKIVLPWLFVGLNASAGVFEVGGTFSYSQSSYNSGSYSWTRTWAGNFGYYFTKETEVEFVYSDATTKNFVAGAEDLTYRDRTYSLNILLHFMSEESTFKPYLRGGVGQLNRDATGTFNGGYSPPGELDQITVIGGAGLKMKLYSNFGLKAEVTSYMVGGNISTWKDNISLNVGGSFYF